MPNFLISCSYGTSMISTLLGLHKSMKLDIRGGVFWPCMVAPCNWDQALYFKVCSKLNCNISIKNVE